MKRIYFFTFLISFSFSSFASNTDLEQKLLDAVEFQNLNTVRTLLNDTSNNEFNLNAENSDGESALFLAAKEGYIEIVELLSADKRVNPNQEESFFGMTPLMIAAFRDKTKVVKELLKNKKINLNIKDEEGATALTNALSGNSLEAFRVIAENQKTNLNIISITPLVKKAYESEEYLPYLKILIVEYIKSPKRLLLPNKDELKDTALFQNKALKTLLNTLLE